MIILCAVTDAENSYARNPYKLRLPDFLKSAIVTARSITRLSAISTITDVYIVGFFIANVHACSTLSARMLNFLEDFNG